MKTTRIKQCGDLRRIWWAVQTRSLLWPFWTTRQCFQHPADAQAAAKEAEQ